jgi:DNA-binding phage protein
MEAADHAEMLLAQARELAAEMDELRLDIKAASKRRAAIYHQLAEFLSVAQIAGKLGVTREAVYRVLRESRPKGEADQRVALSRLIATRFELSQQLGRLEESSQRQVWNILRNAQTRQYVMTLRGLLRAVGMVKDTSAAAVGRRIDEARSEFNRSVPHVRVLRDRLEHFDEWDLADANAYQLAGISNAPAIWYEYAPGANKVSIYVPDLDTVTVNLNEADSAAETLMSRVVHAVEEAVD